VVNLEGKVLAKAKCSGKRVQNPMILTQLIKRQRKGRYVLNIIDLNEMPFIKLVLSIDLTSSVVRLLWYC
jgi:hypothetical protein